MRQIMMDVFLFSAHYARRALSFSDSSLKILFIPGFENVRWTIGKWKANAAFRSAFKHVPAYRKFIKKSETLCDNCNEGYMGMACIPMSDKVNYIKMYGIEERCVGGRIPSHGVMIDESSGTSGRSNNWVRGHEEREQVKRGLQFAFRSLAGNEQVFILNAFALGPWATGMNVSMAFMDEGILKSVGPDVDKIKNTLEDFGPGYKYVIMGYPPFLKRLVDTLEVDFSRYDIIAIFGGEGMSEEMRSYLSKYFKKVYSSYGASDLEINIAAENDFTIALRQEMLQNERLRNEIAGNSDGILPMIFQYNPLDYYIETNKQGELIVTLCRAANIAPKIRYNIHDRGQVIRFPKLREKLEKVGVDMKEIGKPMTDLPLLLHYGRADMAVAFFGCKVTPLNIERIISGDTELQSSVNAFRLITFEDESVNKQFHIALECVIEDTYLKDRDVDSLSDYFIDQLAKINQDFRESIEMVSATQMPKVIVYGYQEGPFKDADIRLKRKYIESESSN